MKKIFQIVLFLSLFYFLLPTEVEAAARYWCKQNASANWNATAPTNWGSASNTSDGASVPTSTDDVYFDGVGCGANNATLNIASAVKTIDFTGYTNTLTHNNGATLVVYGDLLKFSTGMTYSRANDSTSDISFVSTTGTSGSPTVINTNGKTVSNVTINAASGYFKLANNLTGSASAKLTVAGGTFDADTYNVSFETFDSSGISARTIKIGSGQWSLTGRNKNVWTTSTSTNLTIENGTNNINLTGSGVGGETRTIQATGGETATASFGITAGVDSISLGASNTVKNLIISASIPTLNLTTGLTVYGNLSLPSGISVGGVSSGITFAATSGTKTITTNGSSLNNELIFNGAGGTWQFQNDINVTTKRITLSAGTLDFNNNNVTCGAFASSGTGVRTLTMGSGTITVDSASPTTVWNMATATNLTVNTNTSTIVLSDATATAKTFAGGGKTFNNISFTGDNYIISGANTFNNFGINNAGRTNGLKLTSGTTQTITGTISNNGSLGSLSKLLSTTGGSAATISKASGTVNLNYMSIQDSTATGGAVFYAGSGSTNVSGNSGWLFTSPGPTGIKTILGLAVASWKTFLNTALGSLKTLNP